MLVDSVGEGSYESVEKIVRGMIGEKWDILGMSQIRLCW